MILFRKKCFKYIANFWCKFNIYLIRRERSMCRICWAMTAEGDFEVSTSKTGPASTSLHKQYCCSYGTKFTKTATGGDCALIPGALKASDR